MKREPEQQAEAAAAVRLYTAEASSDSRVEPFLQEITAGRSLARVGGLTSGAHVIFVYVGGD